jgi:hypothetical protein
MIHLFIKEFRINGLTPTNMILTYFCEITIKLN